MNTTTMHTLSKLALALAVAVTTVTWTTTAKAEEVNFSNLSPSDYQNVFNEYVAIGYRPVVITGYETDGEVRFDVTYAPSDGHEFHARHHIGDREFASTSRALTADGYRLVLHSSYRVHGKHFHAAVWER